MKVLSLSHEIKEQENRNTTVHGSGSGNIGEWWRLVADSNYERS